MKRIAVFALLLVALAAPAGAQGPITTDDIERARAERNAVSAQLGDASADYEAAVVEEMQVREDLQTLAAEIAVKERELETLRANAAVVVTETYMGAGNDGIEMLFDSSQFVDIPLRALYLDLVSDRDAEVLARLEAVEASYFDQQERLDVSVERQEQLVGQLSEIADEILSELEAAETEYRSIVAAWERQEEERRRREAEERRRQEEAARAAAAAAATTTTSPAASSGSSTDTVEAPTDTTTTTAPPPPPAPPPVVTDGRTCPVNGAVAFSDSWGAARSGGRRHKGVDMIAARGTPIVAVESGTLSRLSTGSLGGNAVYMTGNSGDRFYYAHLDSFADGVGGGLQVSVGDLLGYNGSSGNASYSVPHLHFQHAPAGGDWVNPYPLAAALCR
jgi:murein DD-endopeptidase MepM/ murein hydrolase activator NlpD